MRLIDLRLIHYRNYKSERLDFDGSLNVFIGDNAQGKTNLLESIYYAAKGTSFKSVRDSDIIQFGEQDAYIGANIENNGRKKKVEVKFRRSNTKRIRINEIEIENLKSLTNQFDVVLFSPEDLKIVKEGPQLRRRLIDDQMTSIYPLYKNQLSQYNKILLSRNYLLKRSQRAYFKQQLEVINLQLAQSAAPIMRARHHLIERLNVEARSLHQQLTNGKETISYHYKNCLQVESFDQEQIVSSFLEELSRSLDEDIRQRSTQVGPHKDDVTILIDDRSVKSFGSQGQQRTAMLTTRLCELRIVEHYNKRTPILLLDDVFSELDDHRSGYFVETIRPYQTIITTNSLDNLKHMNLKGYINRVERGKVYRGKQ